MVLKLTFYLLQDGCIIERLSVGVAVEIDVIWSLQHHVHAEQPIRHAGS